MEMEMEMEALYCAEAALYVALVALMGARSAAGHKKAVAAWRVSAAVSVLGLALSKIFEWPARNLLFVVLLLLQNFAVMPLLSPNSACRACGRRVYWTPLISERCPRCGKTLYEKFGGLRASCRKNSAKTQKQPP
jgi:predicted RNA-binding Zn-ribbon protein involved in translation (DUF1610 family)